ncbi:MAG: hypothetical protein ACD_33C00030G0005 [uncultured bacterium]|nr:MAG: hypothetical protein ACD_33C00030G0005 [uncultured bacterium]
MIRHGNPPYLECSSKGDKRFSAFYAKIRKYNFLSIERLYQSSKKFDTTYSNWKLAKGKKAINQEEVTKLYSLLWDEYINENPELKDILINSSGLQDIFGQEGHCCQATELWRIRNQLMNTENLNNYDIKIIVAGTRNYNDCQLPLPK